MHTSVTELGMAKSPIPIEKIVSGGQTGADRAALDWAIENDFPHGGWCPKGRRAEDGVIPVFYELKEHTSKEYLPRTERNVKDSDATAVFSLTTKLSGGTKRTVEFAEKHGKPVCCLTSETEEPGPVLRAFCKRHAVKVLNVAGPRESSQPEIAEFVIRILDMAFPEARRPS